MTKHFRKIKTSFVMMILLASLFIAFLPTASAGPFINLTTYIDVNWSGNETERPIVPRGVQRELDLVFRFAVSTGALPSQILFRLLYESRQTSIKVEIIDTPTWVTAGLKSGSLPVQLSTQEVTVNNKLTLRVDVDAPAFGGGYVRLKASVPKTGPIDGFEQEFYLEFTPDYLPLISTQLPEGNSKRVGPLDSAIFPIEIENMGNARTRVFLEVENIPPGWIAVVTDDITIDEAVGSKGMAYLTIKPPRDFGYHFEEQSFRVSMEPARAEDLNNRGEKTYVTVIVESRGFSTPGFESILVVIALFSVALLYHKKKTSNGK